MLRRLGFVLDIISKEGNILYFRTGHHLGKTDLELSGDMELLGSCADESLAVPDGS